MNGRSDGSVRDWFAFDHAVLFFDFQFAGIQQGTDLERIARRGELDLVCEHRCKPSAAYHADRSTGKAQIGQIVRESNPSVYLRLSHWEPPR